jgi:hypothetical protein
MNNSKAGDGNRREAGSAAIPVMSLSQPTPFRIVLVSFLAAGIGLIAGLHDEHVLEPGWLSVSS